MTTELTETTSPPIAAVRERLSGRVILPSDADYEAARVAVSFFEGEDDFAKAIG